MRATRTQKDAVTEALNHAYEQEQLTRDELGDRLELVWIAGASEDVMVDVLTDTIKRPAMLVADSRHEAPGTPVPRDPGPLIPPLRGASANAAGWQTVLMVIAVFGGLIGLVAWTAYLVDRA